MPFVEIDSPTQGKATIHYEISTPTETSAKYLDHSLPVVLFLHAENHGIHIFHPQFEDPQLRRFNLVAMDLRAHGETEGAVNGDYGPEDGAFEVVAFMDKIGIKSGILVGVSMGTTIAIHVAVTCPERVNGMFLVSPLGTEEPGGVAEGREEILDTFHQAFSPTGELIDPSAMKHALFGVQQLAWSNTITPLVHAISQAAVRQVAGRFGNPDTLLAARAMVNMLTRRRSHTKEALSRINCPVMLMHCSESVAYDLAFVMEFFHQLQEASVSVTLKHVQAVQFGNVTRPDLVNPMMADFLLHTFSRDLPPPPKSVTSPFEAQLVEAGLGEEDDDDSE